MPEILASLFPTLGAEVATDALGGALAGGAATGLGADAFAGLGADALTGALAGGTATGLGSETLAEVGAGALTGAGTDAALGATDAATGAATGITTGAATGLDLSSFFPTGDIAIPENAALTSGTNPLSFGNVTAGGPVTAIPGGELGGAATGLSAASTAAPAGSSPLDLTSLLSKADSKIADNPLGLALAAGGLGYNIFKGQSDTAATQRIQTQDADVKKTASDITGQGQALAAHTEAGTLPPAMQQQLDNQIKDAKTKMISTYASNGMNTDPAKNSMLRQELSAIDKQGLALKGDLEKQLLASGATLINSGTALTGADNDLIKTLSNIDQKSNERIGTAIANFASALSGKTNSGITLNLGNRTV